MRTRYTWLILVLSVALILALTGCDIRIGVVDPILAPYVQVFKNTFNVDFNYISVQFGSTGNSSNNFVGVCSSQAGVIILKPWFDSQTEELRTLVVMHELGHCYFGYVHDEDLLIDGCPASFMFWMIPSQQCYMAHKDTMYQTYRPNPEGH